MNCHLPFASSLQRSASHFCHFCYRFAVFIDGLFYSAISSSCRRKSNFVLRHKFHYDLLNSAVNRNISFFFVVDQYMISKYLPNSFPPSVKSSHDPKRFHALKTSYLILRHFEQYWQFTVTNFSLRSEFSGCSFAFRSLAHRSQIRAHLRIAALHFNPAKREGKTRRRKGSILGKGEDHLSIGSRNPLSCDSQTKTRKWTWQS